MTHESDEWTTAREYCEAHGIPVNPEYLEALELSTAFQAEKEMGIISPFRGDFPIDPNMLLHSIRRALALGHPGVIQSSFATLDDQLTNGGALPDDWKRTDE
jgi:hypothetical protein